MSPTDLLPVIRRSLLLGSSLILVAACASSGTSTGAYGAPVSAPSSPSGPVAGASAAAGGAPASTAPTSSSYYGASGDAARKSGRYGSGAASANPGAGSAEVVLKVATIAQLGTFLTDGTGRTLYVFKKDGPDSSVCTGTCATNWPALTMGTGQTLRAPSSTTGLGSFTRPDGVIQVTFHKAPLYYFSGDSNPGDANGQGIGGVWFVASVGAAASASPTAGGGYGN